MGKEFVSLEVIGRKIYLIRGHKIMLDKDLAILYGIKAIRLREQVKRNIRRFPDDFMFQLTDEEISLMVSQNAIPSRKHLGGYNPYVFTEQGVAMLSSVINSECAIQVNIFIMRAFVNLREILGAHKELAAKLKELEGRLDHHDVKIRAILNTIQQLMSTQQQPKRRIGFHVD